MVEESSLNDTPAAEDKQPLVLRLNNVEVIYDHVILVLKGVSLDVPKGSIVALLGANGAGKTTTLRLFLIYFGPNVGMLLRELLN